MTPKCFAISGLVSIAYTSSGTALWLNRQAGGGGGGSEPAAIATDGIGNIHVAGFQGTYALPDAIVTITYSATGTGLRTNHFNATGCDQRRRATALVVDKLGNEYVTGYSIGCYGNYDCITICCPAPASLPIPLAIQKLANQLVLTWTNPQFSLQSSANPAMGYTNVPGASSPYTNTPNGGQKFFRLKAN